MSIFKPIFVAHTLEKAAQETLAMWMPTYIREIELQLGLEEGLVPAPRTYTTRNKWIKFPEDQMPICVVISPGLAGEPEVEGNGRYSAWWSLGIGVIASAAREEDTVLLSQIYAAAVRAIMLQQGDLGGVCSAMAWIDEDYEDLPDESQTRTLRAAQWVGRALVDDVVTRFTGPTEPADPITMPGSDWPTITSGSIIVVKED